MSRQTSLLNSLKKNLKDTNGKIELASNAYPLENHGTEVKIILPLSNQPNWFVQCIRVKPHAQIIIFDDDQTIHQIWDGKFNSELKRDIKIEHISSCVSLRRFYSKNFADLEHAIFLMDYEIIGQNETGLDLIEGLGIAKQSILVTSRYEESDIRARCECLAVKLIPKPMVAFVPIEII